MNTFTFLKLRRQIQIHDATFYYDILIRTNKMIENG